MSIVIENNRFKKVEGGPKTEVAAGKAYGGILPRGTISKEFQRITGIAVPPGEYPQNKVEIWDKILRENWPNSEITADDVPNRDKYNLAAVDLLNKVTGSSWSGLMSHANTITPKQAQERRDWLLKNGYVVPEKPYPAEFMNLHNFKHKDGRDMTALDALRMLDELGDTSQNVLISACNQSGECGPAMQDSLRAYTAKSERGVLYPMGKTAANSLSTYPAPEWNKSQAGFGYAPPGGGKMFFTTQRQLIPATKELVTKAKRNK